MNRFLSLLILAPAFVFSNASAQAASVRPVDRALSLSGFGDIAAAQQRTDGHYVVLCNDGTREVVTDLDLKAGNACPNVPAPSRSEIISIQKRADGNFDVICRDLSPVVASQGAIMKGQVCSPAPLPGAGLVDILWIVDNSGSMGQYQKQIAKSIDAFIGDFVKTTRLDWKMGLVSTDLKDQPYVGFVPGDVLTRASVNPVEIFKKALETLGTSGDGLEKIYEPILGAFKKYPDFIRANSTLVFVIVTDASEQSSVSTPEFLKSLNALPTPPKNVLTYALLGPQDWCQSTDDPPYSYNGSKFDELIKGTGGLAFPICKDHAAAFEKISQDIILKTKALIH